MGRTCGWFGVLVVAVATGCVARRQPPAPPVQAAPAPPRFSSRADAVIESMRKRILGRRASLRDLRRIVTEIAPHVERALQQPELQDDLAALARTRGMSLPEYRRYFQRKQEADLLLESGGDPDAISSAGACGVAQFLAGTGRRCGLRIDAARSHAWTRVIRRHQAAIFWLEQQAPSFSKPAPDGGTWGREEWLAHHRQKLAEARAARRACDERFDPARAIAAQTRYLVHLTRRYGDLDWALQAYHGGEAGVHRTLNLYLAGSASGTLLPAVAARLTGPRRLDYEAVYFTTTPLGRSAAFYYLYGRSDDHRYYWWKVLMAERAIALYRDDPAACEREWRRLRPTQRIEAVWYPDRDSLLFADLDALRRGYRDGSLRPLPANAARIGLRTRDLAPLDPANAGTYKGLRAEAMGALLHLARIYRRNGGKSPLTLVGMVTTERYSQELNRRHPQQPPPGTPPGEWEPNLDYHPTGLCFDLAPPRDGWDQRVLAYALGTLADRHRIAWLVERTQGPERWHVVPNPAYRDELVAPPPAR